METDIGCQPSDWVRRWKHLFPDGEILDMTCGNGRNTALLRLDGHRVLTCGEDVTAIECLVGDPMFTLECRDLETEEWPWDPDRFEGIVITEPVSMKLFRSSLISLAPGGVFLMEVPSANNLRLSEEPLYDERYPEEGALLRELPEGMRLVAYEEGIDAKGRCVVRICFVKPGGAAPYGYDLDW